MVRWLRWHCPPDTGFEIRALAVWGRARYLSVTEAPHNTDFHTWMGKKHFLFLSNRRDREKCQDRDDPANTRRWTNVDLMLAQSRRRWVNIKATLVQSLVFAGDQQFRVDLLISPKFCFFHITQQTIRRCFRQKYLSGVTGWKYFKEVYWADSLDRKEVLRRSIGRILSRT